MNELACIERSKEIQSSVIEMGDDGRDIQSSNADKDQYGLFFTTCLDDEKNV